MRLHVCTQWMCIRCECVCTCVWRYKLHVSSVWGQYAQRTTMCRIYVWLFLLYICKYVGGFHASKGPVCIRGFVCAFSSYVTFTSTGQTCVCVYVPAEGLLPGLPEVKFLCINQPLKCQSTWGGGLLQCVYIFKHIPWNAISFYCQCPTYDFLYCLSHFNFDPAKPLARTEYK